MTEQFKQGFIQGVVSILAKGAKFTKEEWLKIAFLKDVDIPQKEREQRMTKIVAPKVEKMISGSDLIFDDKGNLDITINEFSERFII